MASVEQNGLVARFSYFLRDHAKLLRRLQWGVVLVYACLIIIPACLPLPGNSSHIVNNITIFAQFVFWGIWWPFVLLSMVLLGRAWCGWLCPEGMLTEWASEHGRGKSIPKWMRWQGWPFTAFCLTTIYGQLVSVYQYPLAVLAVLGGSTVAAIIVGFWYGKKKRVWCKYLCPVNGVFALLSKLAPWHYKVHEEQWRNPTRRIETINCAPLQPLRAMESASGCHMCGRCADYRGSIALESRSPEAEIVDLPQNDSWQSRLIIFGLMGVALGAFLWSASPWFVTLKQALAEWLVDHNIMWPLSDNAPWFILTHYPEVNDSFTWLDGFVILLFILITTVVVGGILYASMWLVNRLSSQSSTHIHALIQNYIPMAGMGVFLGLSATTLTLIQHEGLATGWANPARYTLLLLSCLWSLRLFIRLLNKRQPSLGKKLTSIFIWLLGIAPYCFAWVLFFSIW